MKIYNNNKEKQKHKHTVFCIANKQKRSGLSIPALMKRFILLIFLKELRLIKDRPQEITT